MRLVFEVFGPRDVILPIATYDSRRVTSGVLVVPDEADGFVVEVPRCTDADTSIWADPESKIAVEVEASFDGGNTWVAGGGFEAFGGVHVRRDKTQGAASALRQMLPPAAGRLLRVSIKSTKPARTRCDLLFARVLVDGNRIR